MPDSSYDNPYADPWPRPEPQRGAAQPLDEPEDVHLSGGPDGSDDGEIASPVVPRTPLQQLYLHAWEQLESTPSKAAKSSPGLWLLVTLVVFALSLTGQGPETIGLLVAVIFLHEAGHFLAMRLFGYTDVRMFFIPFFGGAATGKKHAAPGWQQAIVVLAGPLPGILLALGLVLARGWHDGDPQWYRNGIAMLLLVNGFNLIPVIPLDGGRLLNLLIFARHPMLELLFRLFAFVCSGAFAALLRSWFFGLVTLQLLMSVGKVYRQAHGRRLLRTDFPDMPRDLLALDEEMRWGLVEQARYVWKSVPDQQLNEPPHVQAVVNTVRELHEETVTSVPGLLSTAFFLGIYAAGILAVPAAGVMIALYHEAGEQRQLLLNEMDVWEKAIDDSEQRIARLEALVREAEAAENEAQRTARAKAAIDLSVRIHNELIAAEGQVRLLRRGRWPNWPHPGTEAERAALKQRIDQTGLRNSDAIRRVIELKRQVARLVRPDAAEADLPREIDPLQERK